MQSYIGVGYSKDMLEMEVTIVLEEEIWRAKNCAFEYTNFFPIHMSYKDALQFVIKCAGKANVACESSGMATGFWEDKTHSHLFFGIKNNSLKLEYTKTPDPQREAYMMNDEDVVDESNASFISDKPAREETSHTFRINAKNHAEMQVFLNNLGKYPDYGCLITSSGLNEKLQRAEVNTHGMRVANK